MTSAKGDAASLIPVRVSPDGAAGVATSTFRRIAIINRGEAAVRLIRAVRELNDERGLGLRAIALYTEPDRRALFVREADEAYDLGPAVSVRADGSRRAAYVDLERLSIALHQCRADAAWVGWGFVAERPEFAELCARLGVTFIGPSPAALRLLGNKIAAKRFAESCGIPVAPWGGGPVGDLDSAHRHASLVGYPLMIKAAEGGGGRGIRVVADGHELGPALERVRGEATSTFGDETTFLERVLHGMHHVEVQVLGDGTGAVWPLGVRDCSLQRRHQKVIEESASAALDTATESRLREWAVTLSSRVAYRGAATVEFLVDAATGEASFLEVNPRLQVEHPVTEAVTGCDIVKLQLDVAMGGRLEGDPPAARGHAVEARLYAEDPDHDFAPAPGVVDLLRLPSGPGIRVDTGIAEGDEIAADYDPMIAKIVAWGRDRGEALARLRRALDETVVVLRGGATNLPFLLRVLRAPEVSGGAVDVGWLDRAGGAAATRPHAEVALLLAAAEVDEAELGVERTRLFTSASRGRPQVPERIGRDIELRLDGHPYRLHLDRRASDAWEVTLDGRRTGLRVRRRGRYLRWIRCLGGTYRALCVEQGNVLRVEVQGTVHTVSRDSGGLMRAPWPALVVDVKVSQGDRVTAGRVLAVLEAMKLETPIVAEAAGVVSAVLVSRNTQVDAGTPLFQIDPSTDQPAERWGSTERLTLPASDAGAEEAAGSARQGLDVLLRLMLGYDVDAAAADAAVRAWRGASDPLEADERRVLQAFADISALSERHPLLDGEGGTGRSLQEQLFNHLRRLVPEPESPELAEGLRRALRHFGITRLQRTPELDDALFWIMRSQQRAALQVPVILALLDRCLERRPDARGGPEELRCLLDDLIQAARHRHPAILDRARELRHSCFDQPLVAAAQRRVYEAVAENLGRLEGSCDTLDRERRIAELVECPQPLHNVLCARFAAANESLRAAMLEVMTRRYYRTRAIGDMRLLKVRGRLTAIGELPLAGQGRGRVVTTFTRLAELPEALRSLREVVAGRGDDEVVADVYTWSDEPLPGADDLARLVRRSLASTPLPPQVRRVVVAATAPGHGQGMAASQHLSFQRAGARYREEPLYRSLHPMMGERLELWRLRRFRIQRLPSPEDIYLFRGVARDDAGDERLFALAEVRDLSAVRDSGGRVVALPTLEEMLLQALASIRASQPRHVSGSRLQWNRVLLYLWPPLTLAADEIYGVVHRLAPEADGLGIEKIVVRARVPGADGELRDTVIELSTPLGTGVSMLRFDAPTKRPIQPLSDHRRKVAAMRRRGLHHPTDILSLLAPSNETTTGGIAPGHFREYDLSSRGRLKPVRRPPGANTANLVVGVIRNFTAKHPEGMRRVIILGDPSHSLGALAEPECRRIIAAIDLAERRGVPLEWFALSSGAKISMDSGTENMDWIARVLRRIVRFTQAGGEINVVVAGINVGAQPYWNAEATMLMHTRGILVMTPEGAMVLTGKEALDYSGGVSAEDNFGIGGFERVMGPNGQAQYWAPDLASACHLLLRHYEHAYRAPGERFPRRAVTNDPLDRDVRDAAHPSRPGSEFTRVGDIFSDELNPGRKKPFDIRAVMAAVIDHDHAPLERWASMRHAEIAVVWDAHLGGWPTCLIGLESRPLPRRGFIPADGPDQWTAGTLFPLSSKKVARALNAASRNRPVVVLANLSGFDGSPESMRRWQLEFGAEIGRAVVNFEGPMVFCVISRYHGGAFVVFSAALNESLEVAAVEGSFASVIGGAPAAAVVFAREVEARTRSDPRIAQGAPPLEGPHGAEESAEAARIVALLEEVRNEKRGDVARAFDSVHTIGRAQEVGSVHRIVAARDLRPYLVDAVERGIARELRRCGARR